MKAAVVVLSDPGGGLSLVALAHRSQGVLVF